MNEQADVKRKRGRPRKDGPILNKTAILDAAMRLLDRAGAAFSIRELARTLGVDSMAIYTYFDGRGALEEAIVIREMQDALVPYDPRAGWSENARNLLLSYAELLAKRPTLHAAVLRLGSRAEGPASLFRKRFITALSPLGLNNIELELALELAVDYVHGFALSNQLADHGQAPLSRLEDVIAFYLRLIDRMTLDRTTSGPAKENR